MSQDSELIRTTVLGGGAWGTALALHCARKGHEVILWAREQDVVDGINQQHENSLYFKVLTHLIGILQFNSDGIAENAV